MFPYTTLFRSRHAPVCVEGVGDRAPQVVARLRKVRRALRLPKEVPGAVSGSVQHFDFAFELAGDGVLRDLQVAMRLKIHPELRLHAEELAQP